MTTSTYLLAGQASELERLQLQSRVWEESGSRLLDDIGPGLGVGPSTWAAASWVGCAC